MILDIKKNENENDVGGDNFIFDLADSFQLLHNAMNRDVAIECGSSLVSAGLPNIRILTKYGPLSLDVMVIIVGLSGVIKTIPLRKAGKIAEKLDIRLPTFTTSEGITSYFAEIEKDKKTGEERYSYKPFGLIINDELSRRFSESKRKGYAVGCIEAYSSLYDHELDEVYLASKGLRKPRSPYITIIAATITNYLPLIPDHFFSQGLAGRFNWVYCDSADEDYITEDIADLTDYKKAEAQFSRHVKTLSKLYAKNPPGPVYITLESGVNEVFAEIDRECKREWDYAVSDNLWSCEYQYLKRLPEMVIKQAARYAVGRQIDQILRRGFSNVTISREDMLAGISHIRRSKASLDTIFLLRQEGINKLAELGKPIEERETHHYTAEWVAGCLGRSYEFDRIVNGMANTKDWFKATRIGDYKTFEKYKNESVATGEVYKVNKRTLTADEIHKCRADLSATKIWRLAIKRRGENYGNYRTDEKNWRVAAWREGKETWKDLPWMSEEEEWDYLAKRELDRREGLRWNKIRHSIINKVKIPWQEAKDKEKEGKEQKKRMKVDELTKWSNQNKEEWEIIMEGLEADEIAEAYKIWNEEYDAEWLDLRFDRECLIRGMTPDELDKEVLEKEKEREMEKENPKYIRCQPGEGEVEENE